MARNSSRPTASEIALAVALLIALVALYWTTNLIATPTEAVLQ